jgi:putative endonuclease
MMFWNKKSEDKSLGQMGEDLAVEYLKNKGFKILERNFCNISGRRLGEVDIIAQIGKEIVFVEVKTREMVKYDETLPEENITPRKLHKLNKIANFYVRRNNLWNAPYRFDAISVWIDSISGESRVKHLESIFF